MKPPSTNLVHLMGKHYSTHGAERALIGVGSFDMYLEHVARYLFAAPYAKGLNVLDAACGTGYGAYYLANRNAKNVIALDISHKVVAYAKTRYRMGKLCFSCGDVRTMPFLPHSFDLITSFETLEHLRDPEFFIAECSRLLKPDSTLIISTPNKIVHEKKRIQVPYHEKEFLLEEFESMVKENFKIQGIFGQIPLRQDQLIPSEKLGSAISRVSSYLPRAFTKLLAPFYEVCIVKNRLIDVIRYHRNGLYNKTLLNQTEVPAKYGVVPLGQIGSHETFKTYIIVAKS
jgi:2-polyprenyl-3-methyl-5-hydroxy-6-metoxy-1,4-benzoquinol methylase